MYLGHVMYNSLYDDVHIRVNNVSLKSIIPCICIEWIGCSQWPTSQCNELLNSDCCFIQCTVNRMARRRRGGAYTYRSLWLDTGFSSTSPLAARAVTLDLLSPLPAPFGVHAQDKQARTRLQTVWSLSEIDKIGDGVLHLYVHLQKAASWKWDFLVCSPPQTSSPTSRQAKPKIFYR